MTTEATRTALVTGATGFVGRHLVRALLARGWSVYALARPTLTPRWTLSAPRLVWHQWDGSFESIQGAIASGRPEVVFHLGALFLAEHQPADIGPLIQANLALGTLLAEAMVQHDCFNLVNAGTAWQHYQGRAYDPVNLYAATKKAFEDILEYYIQARKLLVITLKLYDTFGPDDDRLKLLSLLRQAAAQQREISLSPGEQRLNMVYIDDAIAALLLAADRLLAGKVEGTESYTVPAAETVSLRELVAKAEAVLGQSIPVRWGARPYRAREVMVPWIGPALPGWSCRLTLEEGLRRTFTEFAEVAE